MSEADAAGVTVAADSQERHVRRVGYGIATAGVLATAIAAVSTRPGPVIVYGLLGTGAALVVLEALQTGGIGFSLGILAAAAGAWLWPSLGGASHLVLGGVLVAVGLFNAAVTPYVRGLGERIAEG